jgi:hypothetical protein
MGRFADRFRLGKGPGLSREREAVRSGLVFRGGGPRVGRLLDRFVVGVQGGFHQDDRGDAPRAVRDQPHFIHSQAAPKEESVRSSKAISR